MTEMTESHRTEPHTIHTKGRNTTRSGIVFHHFPTLRRLRRLLRRQAVIAALGPVCRAASNFDNGIAPGAAHGCAPYPAGQSPTFLTGSGLAIAAIVEARRMRTPPSDGAILEHFVMAITAFRHSPNHDGQGAIVTHSTGYRFMNKLDAPTESNVRPLTLQELDEISGGIMDTHTVITRGGVRKTVAGPKPLPDWLY